jgi:hypothetical protein
VEAIEQQCTLLMQQAKAALAHHQSIPAEEMLLQVIKEGFAEQGGHSRTLRKLGTF